MWVNVSIDIWTEAKSISDIIYSESQIQILFARICGEQILISSLEEVLVNDSATQVRGWILRILVVNYSLSSWGFWTRRSQDTFSLKMSLWKKSGSRSSISISEVFSLQLSIPLWCLLRIERGYTGLVRESETDTRWSIFRSLRTKNWHSKIFSRTKFQINICWAKNL